MIEDDLRAAFARQEERVPAAGPVRAAITREAGVRRRRRRRMATVAAAFLLVLGLLPAGWLLVRPDPPATALLPLLGHAAPAGPVTVLVLGVDGALDEPFRADTVLVAHVPADRRAVYLVSIPRDVGLAIPGHGFDKIAVAYALGGGGAAGRKLTGRAVSAATGLRLDGVVALDYRATRRITDALGGVRMCLPVPVTSQHTGKVYRSGCRDFTGAQAVDLARQRVGLQQGAYDRDRNGQRFLRALIQRAGERGLGGSPVLAAELVRAAGAGLAVDTGGLGLGDLSALAAELDGRPVIGIGAPRAAGIERDGARYERLYPGVAGQLFEAVRTDRLAAWAAAHPAYLLR